MTTCAQAPAARDRPPGSLAFDGTSGWRAPGAAAQTRILTARFVKSLLLDRRLLLIGLIEPLMMLTAFGQVFSGIVHAPGFPAGVRYVDFLLPALFLTTALQSGLQAGMGLVDDAREGMSARLRTMPVWPGSILVARSLAGLARVVLRLLFLLTLAFCVFGYRPAGGPSGMLAAVVLALVIGWSLGWVFIALACWVDNAETLHAVAGVVMFPLMFASSAFVPVDGLPSWLGWIARLNPITYGVDAARDLTLTGTAAMGALVAIPTALTIAALALPVAVKGLGRQG
ncbi:ABC transporter permease [Actinomadura algeriensis]|uniref:Transport permease protein n=1 Tax=Actinomadura algeriensis TaxID=1679523 RepID=A0ABR9K1V3_9ACTN|nr:ABC transporter permease [Actinomadura algeriensis]MBE1536698.1 ABC-2 type transport system permease protein [Actinomadura algeriensis]